jgi:hypothetical protein
LLKPSITHEDFPAHPKRYFDAIKIEKVAWNGRLEETEFLARLYDLSALPSRDGG